LITKLNSLKNDWVISSFLPFSRLSNVYVSFGLFVLFHAVQWTMSLYNCFLSSLYHRRVYLCWAVCISGCVSIIYRPGCLTVIWVCFFWSVCYISGWVSLIGPFFNLVIWLFICGSGLVSIDCLYILICVYWSICQHIWVCLLILLFFCVSESFFFVRFFILVCVSWSVCLSVYLDVFLFICLSLCLSCCLSVCSISRTFFIIFPN